MSLENVYELLGTREIPGTQEELEVLCIRIRELTELNGEEWVRLNSKKLLAEWDFVLLQGL
jgi:hypothetical protein